MPGLVRVVARTAVVAGTATAVSGRVARRQQGKWAAKDAQAQQQQYAAQPPPQQPQYVQAVPVQQVPVQQMAAPAVAAPSMDDKLAQLQQLGQLKDAGVLTAAEFEAQKAKILAG